MTVTAQRAQLVDFSIPYYREGVGTLLRKSSPTGARSPQSDRLKSFLGHFARGR